jgi:hypothetical protein
MRFERKSWNSLRSNHKINLESNIFNGDNFSFFKMRNSSHSYEPNAGKKKESKMKDIGVSYFTSILGLLKIAKKYIII